MDLNGRVLPPSKYRNILSLHPNDLVELRAEGQKVILTAYGRRCGICGGKEKILDCSGFFLCESCKAKIP